MFWYGFLCAWVFCDIIILIDILFHLDNIQIYGGLGWLLVLPVTPIVFPILFVKTMIDPYFRSEFIKTIKRKIYKNKGK